jgi:hypothetical protein
MVEAAAVQGVAPGKVILFTILSAFYDTEKQCTVRSH